MTTTSSTDRAGTVDLDTIRLRGVREHNLRGFDLDLAKRSLVVVVGVSGSGKSSLVFDTIAAEAQRQVNATFSAFAQAYLPSYGRPDADRIEHLSAAIVIDQRRLHGGPRSTLATITDIGDWLRLLFSRGATPTVGYSNAFSFNDPAGMCPRCQGLGMEKTVDVAEFLDGSRSLREGPFRHPDYRPGTITWRRYADSGLFDVDVPVEQYSARERHLLLDAEPGEAQPTGPHALPGDYEGALVRFRRIQLAKEPSSLKGEARRAYERLVTTGPCSGCAGTRLNEAARTALLEGVSLPEVYAMQVGELDALMRTWRLGPLDPLVADVVVRLERLVDLGLGYLHLGRDTATLSGGEAQRVKMVRHLGSTLNDMLYVFDEPTTGLHARDVHRLGQMLEQLRDQGNTVIVVEHDPAVMAIADEIVEIGPGAGTHGGRLLFQGSFDALREADTLTGSALRAAVPGRREPRRPTGALRIEHARSHNLQDVSVDVPLGVLTVVTGVAGSGKSSLVHRHLPLVAPDAVLVDQSPIRGSRRSTPASWTGMLDQVRRIFAARTGQHAGLFSPNSDGGCRDCEGTGVAFVELGFTDPVMTRCETCQGRRFRPGALRHLVDGRSIADVFEMTAEDALAFFADARLHAVLARMTQVGLGYLTLGQHLTTLSGGERQRLRLARELSGDAAVIVLDEPTTGLHARDTARLLLLLHEMVDDGRTVVVIEHDLDVIAGADHVIDLGPEGGHDGGRVQFTGTVAELLRTETHTGRYLRERLAG
ncbi:ATP-binding cassette domain-containing protein [Georgenia sp. H159]|uniref:ATP-binding cassette domain-containing protein n=1 Tax=Georgenia sp. H159 TaxID=3076115 RepID=UPI002D76DCA7|nr:ATP-binding cassette domain-containing protein [Georgenia sp. H159]